MKRSRRGRARKGPASRSRDFGEGHMSDRKLCRLASRVLAAATFLACLVQPVRAQEVVDSRSLEDRASAAPDSGSNRSPAKFEILLVNGGRWDSYGILERIRFDPDGPDADLAAGGRPNDAGARLLIAATAMGGRADLLRLINDLDGKVKAEITFREPGTEGRLPAEVAREMLQRWRERLQSDRMTVIDLFRLDRWIRSYYADPQFLTPTAQMRLYFTLGDRPQRTVARAPQEAKALWDFLREGLGPDEFLVCGADRDRDRSADSWMIAGKDRRGEIYLYVPWSAPNESAVVRADGQPNRFARLLKEAVLFESGDLENPPQMIARTVYGRVHRSAGSLSAQGE